MQFCPSLNQTLLSLRKFSGEQGNWSNAENSAVVLVIRMEMRHVMTFCGLDKHPNDDAIKPRKFRHSSSVPARDRPRKTERPNDADHRPGATDDRPGTKALSPGS